MREYRWKPGKLGGKVIGAYQKVEEAFVDAFLEKAGPDQKKGAEIGPEDPEGEAAGNGSGP